MLLANPEHIELIIVPKRPKLFISGNNEFSNLSDVDELPEMSDMVSPQKHVLELLRAIWFDRRAFEENGDGTGRM